MKLSEILNESSNPLVVARRELPGNRTLFTGLSKNIGTIMSRIRESIVCEITTEMKEHSVFIGFVESKVLNQGWATKLLKYVINYYIKQGNTSFSAYIPHNNTASMSLFVKCGFKLVKTQDSGSFYELHI